MWLCARCGGRKPSPLSECETCAVAQKAGAAVALPPAACPACKTPVPGPSPLGRLTCPACAREFPDYAGWLLQCRAAAYAAHPAPAVDAPFQPGPPPPGLTRVARSFFVAAGVQALGGLVWPDVLWPCLLLAALQVAAGVGLLKRPRADRLARLAAGLTALMPVFLVPAAWAVWVVGYFARPEALAHYGPPPDPAPPRRRQGAMIWLLGLAVAVGAAHLLLVQPALRTAEEWEDTLPPLLALGAALEGFVARNVLWVPAGVLAGLMVLGLLGAVRRRAHAWASGLAALALLALLLPGAGGLAHARRSERAVKTLMESDISRLVWTLRQDPDARVRLAAARRLELLGRDARTAAPALEQALEDRDVRVRVAAACALAGLKPQSERAGAVLAEAFAAAPVGRRLLRALEAYGPRARPALPALVARVERDDASIRVLAEIGAASVPGLAELLRHADPAVRRRALDALRRIGPDARSAAPLIEAALKDVEPSVQAEAARALGAVQREKAVPLLVELLQEEGPRRTSAAEALCQLGEKEGLAGPPPPGSGLNALRRPAQWDHLRRVSIDHDLAGTAGEILEELAVDAVLCVEAGPEARPLLAPARRFYGSLRKRTALDVLLALEVPFVLEDDRIRILSAAQAADFWTTWLYEARAGRP